MTVAHREGMRCRLRLSCGELVDRLVAQKPAAVYAATIDGFSNVSNRAD